MEHITLDLAIQQPSNKSAAPRENTLILAVVYSFLLHILIVFTVPSIKYDVEKKPEVLNVELVLPAKPKPAPEPIAKPAEPVKPLEPVKQKLVPQPVTTKPAVQPTPVHEQPAPPEPQPRIIAAIPKPETPPTFTAPPTPPTPVPEPPKPPKPVATSQDDINEAKNTYITSVQKELQRNHRYPKMAERNGIQGIAKVEIKLDKQGNIVSATIVESSGSNVLDDGAIATVRRSNLKQFMKEVLYGHLDTVVVPIAFTLAPN